MRHRRDTVEVERLQVGGVFEHVAELGREPLEFFVGEAEASELRDLLDVGGCDAFGHGGDEPTERSPGP